MRLETDKNLRKRIEGILKNKTTRNSIEEEELEDNSSMSEDVGNTFDFAGDGKAELMR